MIIYPNRHAVVGQFFLRTKLLSASKKLVTNAIRTTKTLFLDLKFESCKGSGEDDYILEHGESRFLLPELSEIFTIGFKDNEIVSKRMDIKSQKRRSFIISSNF